VSPLVLCPPLVVLSRSTRAGREGRVLTIAMHRCSNCGSLFSDAEKRDEHQWLCLWRHSSKSKFGCHCCERQFSVEDERNKHEFLCSLKMPYGFSFTCNFCNCRISRYTHSSFVHHEKHCSLNPDVNAAQRILRKHCFAEVGVFVGGGYKKHKTGTTPFCVCVVDRDRCVVSMTNSVGRPCQKYYRCSKSKKEDRCSFFEWCE